MGSSSSGDTSTPTFRSLMRVVYACQESGAFGARSTFIRNEDSTSTLAGGLEEVAILSERLVESEPESKSEPKSTRKVLGQGLCPKSRGKGCVDTFFQISAMIPLSSLFL